MADEYRLVRTCGACPEQYDVFLGEERVAYLRLRWGFLGVEAFGPGGQEHVAGWNLGDPYQGSFETDEQRAEYLSRALAAVSAVRQLRRQAAPVPKIPYTVEEG